MESGAEAYTPPDPSRRFDMAGGPSGSGEREGGGPPTPLILVILAMLAIRLIVASQIHLTEDEAYYRLWSMAPAFGYFDHPPMIAWWIWLGRRLGGDNALGVRLIPILASAITSLLVFDMARLAGASRRDRRTGGDMVQRHVADGRRRLPGRAGCAEQPVLGTWRCGRRSGRCAGAPSAGGWRPGRRRVWPRSPNIRPCFSPPGSSSGWPGRRRGGRRCERRGRGSRR